VSGAEINEQAHVEKRSFAQKKLDVKLERFLGFTGGFFVEAGANDGITHSNTVYFERHLDWTGLLVEPIPELAARCRRNRPACIVENCALVSLDYERPTIDMHYCDLMSIVRGARRSDEADREHLRAGKRLQEVEPYEVTVPASPLSSLFDRHGVTHCDLLSLDVEGFELSALKGLDLERHRPDWILVESWFGNEIEQYLGAHYEFVALFATRDVLFRARDDAG
jgi:FkbM family methyltransferase